MNRARAARLAVVVTGALAGAREVRADGAAPLVLLIQGDAVAASSAEPPAGAGLRLRRLRVGNDVRAGVLRARVVLEAQEESRPYAALEGGRIADGAPVRLTDAFAAYVPHRAFEVDVGVQRVPFSLSRQVGELDLRLPERAAIIARATPDFRAGVALAGDLGLLQYRGAILAADPALDRAFRGGALVAFRLGADPIGPMGVIPWRREPQDERDPWYAWWRFSAGASILYGTLDEPRTLGLGGDAQLQGRRFTATGEYVFLHGPGGDRQGAVVEPGLFVVRERVEVTLRAAWARLPAPGDGPAAGGAITLYTAGSHLRFQAGFERRRDAGWALLRASLSLD